MIQIGIIPELRPVLYLACFELHEVVVGASGDKFEHALQRETQRLRRQYPEPAAARPLFEPARKLYRAIGVDPTHSRPSSEALIRRLLRGKDLNRVNSVVDCFNLLSIRFALPVGLYDLAHVVPPVELRLGREGEGYPGIGKEFVNVAGRFCLADRNGPFGNPSSDSARARIRDDTHDVLATFFVPMEIGPAAAHATLESFLTTLEELLRFGKAAITLIR